MDPQIIAAGIGALGGALGGGGDSPSYHPMDAIPDFLQGDYMNLMGQIGGLQAPEYYQGNTVAGLNPWINDSLGGFANFGNGMGGQIAGAQLGSGMLGAGAMGGGLGFMNNYAMQGPNQFGYDQGTYNAVMGNLAPGMQATFDKGAMDIQKNFDWNMLPGLNMEAAMSGQQGGSRLGMQSALGQSLTDQNKMQFGLDLWGNASSQANNAAMQAGMGNLGSANSFGQDLMRGYQGFAGLGLPQLSAAYGSGTANLQNALDAGGYMRAFDQQNIDADRARWDYNQNLAMSHLGNQMGLLTGNLPGQVPQGTVGMSPWEGALQGGMMGLGIYDAFFGNQPGTDMTNTYGGYYNPAVIHGPGYAQSTSGNNRYTVMG